MMKLVKYEVDEDTITDVCAFNPIILLYIIFNENYENHFMVKII
jgi:hypothetical protein